MGKQIFVTTLDELMNMMCKYNLEHNGMSGLYHGWHWYSDDEADIEVYFKVEHEEEGSVKN